MYLFMIFIYLQNELTHMYYSETCLLTSHCIVAPFHVNKYTGIPPFFALCKYCVSISEKIMIH